MMDSWLAERQVGFGCTNGLVTDGGLVIPPFQQFCRALFNWMVVAEFCEVERFLVAFLLSFVSSVVS
jgi:hypothetical protein